MKARTYFLFLLLCVSTIQVGYTCTCSAENITKLTSAKILSDFSENVFPPMVIKLYTGTEPNDGIFNCNTNYRFIVQPDPHVVGFEGRSFEFYWYFIDSSENVVSSRYVSPCGIKVGTYIINAPKSGTYRLEVELKDTNGNFVVVERKLRFGY